MVQIAWGALSIVDERGVEGLGGGASQSGLMRAVDAQGFRTAVLAGAEFDAIFHSSLISELSPYGERSARRAE